MTKKPDTQPVPFRAETDHILEYLNRGWTDAMVAKRFGYHVGYVRWVRENKKEDNNDG